MFRFIACRELGLTMTYTTTLSTNPQSPEIDKGGTLTITATLELDDAPHQPPAWQWDYKSEDDWVSLSESSASVNANNLIVGNFTYRATPLDKDSNPIAGAQPAMVKVTIRAPGTAPTPSPATPAVPLIFKSWFALSSLLVLLLVLIVFVWKSDLLSLSVSFADDVAENDPRAALAAKVMGPILVIGTAMLAIGIWMIAVEWRGAFADRPRTKGLSDGVFAAAVGALKDLKGANLVVIGGIVLILSVAWMVSATVSSTAPTPDPSASTAIDDAPSIDPSGPVPAPVESFSPGPIS